MKLEVKFHAEIFLTKCKIIQIKPYLFILFLILQVLLNWP